MGAAPVPCARRPSGTPADLRSELIALEPPLGDVDGIPVF